MSEMAIKLVKECIAKKSEYLDLGRCGLRDSDFKKGSILDRLLVQCSSHLRNLALSNAWHEYVDNQKYYSNESVNKGEPNFFTTHPPCLIHLSKLTALKIGGDRNYLWTISNLRFVAAFPKLEVLYAAYNNIKSIEGTDNLYNLKQLHLPNNLITELSGLDNLKNLLVLDINDNEISELKGLDGLSMLHILRLRNNPIGRLSSLDNLSNLQLLNVSGTEITELCNLDKLNKLSILFAFNNQIRELKGLETLNNLKYINVSRNKISDLRPLLSLRPFVENRFEFDVEGNPLKTPPPEVVKQGATAIKNYFAQIDKEKGKPEYLFEAKLLVIGEGGAGKTSFIRKLQKIDAELPEEKDTTLGIDVCQWSYEIEFKKIPGMNNAQFHVNLWDFGGQKIYQGTHQIFFSDKSLYVLLADTREQKTDFSYWLNTVEQLGGENSALVIVLNKKYGHEVKFDEGYKGRFGNVIKDVVSLDLKHNTPGMQQLQDIIKLRLKQLDGIGDPLPPSWVKIREALSREKENFISFDHFKIICKKYKITDTVSLKTVSGYFSRIGAITHYYDDDVLRERVYLKSNWLVKTVYEVLDNKAAKEKKGRLKEADVKEMWSMEMEQKKKKGEQAFDIDFVFGRLTQLMHKFGLMYHVPDKDEYVIPEHLPATQPYKKWKYADSSPLLRFSYEFDKYMPQGIMSHLIVLLHDYIDGQENVWHKGINIFSNGSFAEIIETLGNKNSFEIRIAGSNRRELLAIVRDRFNKILKPFTNLEYRQQVPCICATCRNSPIPHFYDYEQLLVRLNNNKSKVECVLPPIEEVSIHELLDNIEVPQTQNEEGMRTSKKRAAPKRKKIFISYSHTDEKLWKNKFVKQLSSLEGAGLIEHWHDRKIEPGRWNPQIKAAMEDADIFILLITANFLSSDYITTHEITTAYNKWKEGKAQIIPVICDSCKWRIKPLGEGLKLGDLSEYPLDGKPIKNWPNPNDGFLDVIDQLERLIKSGK